MESSAQRRLIEEVANVVISHADELTTLDQAIGDGDHGLNMKRGALAILERLDDLAAKPLPDALTAAGQTLVMKVGGASGPLYGTLLMTLGKDLPMAPSRDELARAVGLAVAAVKKIGRSDVGQKTMLDVLGPVHEELASGGIMILPLGPHSGTQKLVKFTKSEQGLQREDLIGVRFVPLLPGPAREL